MADKNLKSKFKTRADGQTPRLVSLDPLDDARDRKDKRETDKRADGQTGKPATCFIHEKTYPHITSGDVRYLSVSAFGSDPGVGQNLGVLFHYADQS